MSVETLRGQTFDVDRINTNGWGQDVRDISEMWYGDDGEEIELEVKWTIFETNGKIIDFKIIIPFKGNSLKYLIKLIDEKKKKIETYLENEVRQ